VSSELIAFALDDVIRLKKPHPCGSFEWTIVRLGADIGLRCQSCGRRVLLPRREVERRLRNFVTRSSSVNIAGASERSTTDDGALEARG